MLPGAAKFDVRKDGPGDRGYDADNWILDVASLEALGVGYPGMAVNLQDNGYTPGMGEVSTSPPPLPGATGSPLGLRPH